jgi:ankyrin repeat protein
MHEHVEYTLLYQKHIKLVPLTTTLLEIATVIVMLYAILQTDKRGDTPLHAAACNGATACLLLLLQYGCAPDVRNKRSLRPIDLAAKRGHAAAEKASILYTKLYYTLYYNILYYFVLCVLMFAACTLHRC